MINYTERIGQLMADVVARVPTLSFIDMSRVLVFARAGRSDAEGPYATCHCVSLPPSEAWLSNPTHTEVERVGVKPVNQASL